MAERLGLTEEQITKLKKMSNKSKAKQKKLMEAMKAAGKKQAELMSAEELDRKAIKRAVHEVGKIRTEMGWNKTEELLALREILTKEQSKQLHDMRKRRFQKQKRGGERKRRTKEDKHPEGDNAL